LLSQEGVTQGDPLAMLLYALAVLPLIRLLKKPEKWTQNWYADDSACLASFENLLTWFKTLVDEGPKYGYFPEPEKSFLIVHPKCVEHAKTYFKDWKINIVSGQRFLGGFIGSVEDTSKWLNSKLNAWTKAISKLSFAAQDFPQAAFTSFTKSLQNEWAFLQRILQGTENFFSMLKTSITSEFLPSLFGLDLSASETELMCRPASIAGLGINDPVKTATSQFQNSKEATKVLVEAIQSGRHLNLNDHQQCIKNMLSQKNAKPQALKAETKDLLFSQFSDERQRIIQRKLDYKCSTWLTVLPKQDNFFSMSADEFRDALSLRYGRTPPKMPSSCDADGESFDLNHALNCPRGGLVYGRHNEIRDLNCHLFELAGLKQITSEPILCESDVNGENGLRADWGARGFWEPQKMSLFDVSIFNADSSSYKSQPLTKVFEHKRNIKKQTYSKAAEAKRATFTPFIATCDAALDKEAETYIKHLASLLSKKWKCSDAQTVGWLRARIQICILRSVSLCVRGSRTKWRGAGTEDGNGIASFDKKISKHTSILK